MDQAVEIKVEGEAENIRLNVDVLDTYIVEADTKKDQRGDKDNHCPRTSSDQSEYELGTGAHICQCFSVFDLDQYASRPMPISEVESGPAQAKFTHLLWPGACTCGKNHSPLRSDTLIVALAVAERQVDNQARVATSIFFGADNSSNKALPFFAVNENGERYTIQTAEVETVAHAISLVQGLALTGYFLPPGTTGYSSYKPIENLQIDESLLVEEMRKRAEKLTVGQARRFGRTVRAGEKLDEPVYPKVDQDTLLLGKISLLFTAVKAASRGSLLPLEYLAASKPKAKHLRQLIIKTNSDYLVTMPGNLPKWQSNGWKTSKGRPIKNVAELKMFSDVAHGLMSYGIRIMFWKVPTAQNKGAAELARRTLNEYGKPGDCTAPGYVRSQPTKIGDIL